MGFAGWEYNGRMLEQKLVQGCEGVNCREVMDLPEIQTWGDLVKLVKSISKQVQRGLRSAEEDKSYNLYMPLFAGTHRCVSDFILGKMGDREAMVDYNLFPYDGLIDGLNKNGWVEHLVIWSRDGGLDEERIEVELDKIFGKGEYEWIGVVNSVKNQSVPELWHAQLFVKVEGNWESKVLSLELGE